MKSTIPFAILCLTSLVTSAQTSLPSKPTGHCVRWVASPVSAVETITDGNFNSTVENTSRLVLIDFYADWCSPCRRMHPVVESLAYEYAGQVIVGRLNTDENQADDILGVDSLPTFMFIKNNRIVHKVVGAVSKETLVSWIEYFK